MTRTETICNRLNELLFVKNISVRELCQITGLQYTAVNNYLTGYRTPRIDTICLISETTNTDIRWLVGYDLKGAE